jgi:energy-coupling factor transporter ATP-binding protein EcfA2
LARDEIEARLPDVEMFANIGEFFDQPVKTYSSGMYVRLGFAVAVHVDPDVLLIDEVLSVGDEEFSQKCVAKIQEMKYRGVTLIFVTHQLDQVRKLCDRAVWLDRGEAVSIGDPVRVVDAYLQQVAAGTGAARVVRAEPLIEAIIDHAGDEVAEDVPLDDEEELNDDLPEEERWGSGELVLRRVALMDPHGRELVALGAGTPVTIEMDVEVRVPQDDFVFGIGIYHADGSCVYGTNTDLEGFVSEKVEADGRVSFVIPSLELVAGSYRIDAAVHTRNGRAFDYRRGVLRFVVGSRVHDIGVYRPKHEWRFEGVISVRTIDMLQRNVPATIAESIRSVTPEEEPEPAPKFRKRRRRTEES